MTTTGLRQFFGKLPPAIRFVAAFLGLLLVLSLVFSIGSAVFDRQMVSLMTITARIVAVVLETGGMDVQYQGRYISAARIAVEVIEECTGLYEMVIFLAAVLAYPASRREKLIGAAGGIVLLYSLNILRMVLLVAAGNAWPDWFDFMHIYFWQVTLILMIASVWLLWLLKVVKGDARRVLVRH